MANLTISTPGARRPLPNNDTIADALERIAALLEEQDANPYRVQAYRTAAGSIRAEPASLAQQDMAEGTDALERLRGIGPRIARHIDTLVHTGRLPLLEQLQGEAGPEALLASVPGIGPKSAHEIHTRLGISTLEELELAAHDGRLQQLAGFGPRRVAGLRHTLGSMLGQRARWRSPHGTRSRPPAPLLLEVDADYRRQAALGRLPAIAPRRFNPNREPWLPILHTERGGWSFTAAYSNTARAHQLERVGDWVLIYYEHDDVSDQCTVVTETRGPLRGRRVIRGREGECIAFYEVEPPGREPDVGTQRPAPPP
jgi:DNA polymerase (family 10)